MKVRSLRVCIALAVAIGCSSDQIHRADLRSWRTTELRNEGIALDLPVETFNRQLHYRSNGIADAIWFISISVQRKDKASFADPLQPSPENPLSSNANYMNWLRWKQAYHPEISVSDSTNGSKEYRRDLQLPEGDIVSIHATYRYAPFSETERAADDAAIRRILTSARPIGR